MKKPSLRWTFFDRLRVYTFVIPQKLGEGVYFMEKQIELKHHVHDYECMWNGIEDLYSRDTQETLPPSFFFSLASFGSFCYQNTPNAELKRMIAFGDGRTKQMYQFLAPIVGFEYRHYTYPTFEQALKKAKAEVCAGYPVVLGALDMYYLPYYAKLYHKEHIPFHYALMAGFDDGARECSLLDCGRYEAQRLPYDELRPAWGCSYPGLSKPNTICTVRMHAVKNKYQIAKEALAQKAALFLHPPVSFVGSKGFDKLIQDLPKLKTGLIEEDYKKLFTSLVTFLGSVPTVPNALRGSEAQDEVSFCGGFDKISRILYDLGDEYDAKQLLAAAVQFEKGAGVVTAITNSIVEGLTTGKDNTDELQKLFAQTKQIMTDGFTLLQA